MASTATAGIYEYADTTGFTLQSSEPISSVEYTIDMGTARNSMGFNFAVPVPEPSTLALAVTSGAGAAVWMRRRRKIA